METDGTIAMLSMLVLFGAREAGCLQKRLLDYTVTFTDRLHCEYKYTETYSLENSEETCLVSVLTLLL